MTTNQFLIGLNHTFIDLIPKKNLAITVADFHPISLCNFIYKLISDVITNMLKLILLFLISETPSAFIPRRQIFYNLLIAYKLVHFLKRRNIRKWGYMSIKLDMSKIYDRVE